MTIGSALARQLFDFRAPPSRGESIHFRIFEAFICASTVQLAWYWAEDIPTISHQVLQLGIANYIDPSFMYGNQLALVNAALITLAVAIGFTRKNRFSYTIAFLALHLQFSARFVLGKGPHSANLVGMALLGFVLAELFFRERIARSRFAIGFSCFFVGLGYTMASVCKFIATGITWPAGRHLWMWIYEKQIDNISKFGDFPLSAWKSFCLSSLTVSTIVLGIGLITEMFSSLLWWKKARPFVGLALIGMHVGIKVTMGITFVHSTILVALLTLPWGWIFDRYYQRRTNLASPSLDERTL